MNTEEIDTFSTSLIPDSTYTGSRHVSYNLDMHRNTILDDKTLISTDNTSKVVTNVKVQVVSDGFDLVLYHAIAFSGDHVDEAEIVASWHFNDIQHLEFINSIINKSVDKQISQK